jgi:hypothetical protein
MPCPLTDWYANYGGSQPRHDRASPESWSAVLNVSDGSAGMLRRFAMLLPAGTHILASAAVLLWLKQAIARVRVLARASIVQHDSIGCDPAASGRRGIITNIPLHACTPWQHNMG